MTLQEQITEEMKLAMISRDIQKRDYLRIIVSEFNKVGRVISDELAMKELRKLQGSAIIMNNQYELDTLDNYIPKKLSDDDTKTLVAKVINDHNFTSTKEMGKIMGVIKTLPNSSLLDNTIVSKYIKELLA